MSSGSLRPVDASGMSAAVMTENIAAPVNARGLKTIVRKMSSIQS